MDIGGELRDMRMEAGFTQRNVADLLIWDIAKLSKIEHNKQEITHREYKELEALYTAEDRPRKIDEFTIDYQPQHAVMR